MSVLKTKSLLFARALSLLLTLIVFCGVANAYTIVMRGGRHVEVPYPFLLTDSTLTYEVSPGIQVTINVSAIDIPATEKANKEAAGAFLRHRQSVSSPSEPLTQTQSQNVVPRTITNRELQSLAVKRQESEKTYEKRRQELGLPAPTIETPATIDWEQRRAAELEQENYWRSRTQALRTEIAVVDVMYINKKA